MLKRILALFVAFPIGAILVAIAVSNRQPVALILDPFRPDNPALSIELPFYLYLLGALVVVVAQLAEGGSGLVLAAFGDEPPGGLGHEHDAC